MLRRTGNSMSISLLEMPHQILSAVAMFGRGTTTYTKFYSSPKRVRSGSNYRLSLRGLDSADELRYYEW